MKKINCAIIGFGNIGKLQAEFLIKNKNTDLIYICEKNVKIVQKNKNKYRNIKWPLNENEIFKDKRIDLVLISSYDNFHYSQILKAIKHNKHIFCEKPICQNLSQLRKINSLLKKKRNLNFSSNLILRTVSEFKLLKSIINKKKIGQIYYSEADYNYGRLNKITKGWRSLIPFYSVVSGGGVHVIDIICNFLKEHPTSVFAYANNIITEKSKFKYNDFVVSILKFKSKKISKVSANFGCNTPHHHQVKFFGTKGTYLKEFSGSNLIMSRDNIKKKAKKFFFKKKYNKSELLDNFIENLNKNSNVKKIPSIYDVIRVMLVCFAIEKSFKTNKEIKINYKNITLN